jgi:hypothetical protein
MPLVSLLLGWAVVTAWFVGWELVSSRVEGSGRWLRAPLWVFAGEALAVSLLGALWFGSLGAGGWPLVFGLLGVMVEWPIRLRAGGRAVFRARRMIPIAGGIVRLLGAGAALAWWLA